MEDAAMITLNIQRHPGGATRESLQARAAWREILPEAAAEIHHTHFVVSLREEAVT